MLVLALHGIGAKLVDCGAVLFCADRLRPEQAMRFDPARIALYPRFLVRLCPFRANACGAAHLFNALSDILGKQRAATVRLDLA